MRTVEDIANGIIDLCRRAQFDEALDRYYSPDIVSVESAILPVVGKEQRGLKAVQAKNDWWGERFSFTEMALYTVEKGQVAREEFYYPVA